MDTLNDAEKAKIFYLTSRDAKRFIRKTITEENAHKLLVAQVGAKRAARFANEPSNERSYIKGHRAWLEEYIDTHIELKNFYCPKIEHTTKQESNKLEDIIDKIKGNSK